MKKAIVALALAGFASTAMATIAGSAHDLSNDTGAALSSCQFCHTPHNANVSNFTINGFTDSFVAMPLWNRKAPTQTYAYYTNVSDTTVTVGAGSYTCLSCHDGSSDIGDTYRGSRGFPATRNIVTAGYTYANLTTNLQDDHPVGVTYSGTGANGYVAIAQVRTTFNNKLYGATADTVECGTCHDPHGTTALGGGSDHASGGASFLRVNANTICSQCHLK